MYLVEVSYLFSPLPLWPKIQSILLPHWKERLSLGAMSSQEGLSVLVENDVGIDTFDRLGALPGVGFFLA